MTDKAPSAKINTPEGMTGAHPHGEQTERPKMLGTVGEGAAADLEFSDYGRDSRFPPGWWIGALFSLALAIALITLAVTLFG